MDKDAMRKHLHEECRLMGVSCLTCEFKLRREATSGHDCKAGLLALTKLLRQQLAAKDAELVAQKMAYLQLNKQIDPTCVLPEGFRKWGLKEIEKLLREVKPKCPDGTDGEWNLFFVAPFSPLC